MAKCSICLERVNAAHLFSCCGCTHLACKSCSKQHYAVHQLQDSSKFPLRCFALDCKARVRKEEVKKRSLFTAENWAKYNRFTQHAEAKRKAMAAPGHRVVECPDCGTAKVIKRSVFSYFWSRGWAKLTCAQCASSFEAAPETNSMSLWTLARLCLTECAQPCPSCGHLVIKNGGCSHMRCRCGASWTWLHVPFVSFAVKSLVYTLTKLMIPLILLTFLSSVHALHTLCTGGGLVGTFWLAWRCAVLAKSGVYSGLFLAKSGLYYGFFYGVVAPARFLISSAWWCGGALSRTLF